MLCSGMMMVVFLEMLRAVFSARFLRMKLPKPRRYTFSFFSPRDCFTVSMNASTVTSTEALSRPVLRAISLTISAFVIIGLLVFVLNLYRNGCKDIIFSWFISAPPHFLPCLLSLSARASAYMKTPFTARRRGSFVKSCSVAAFFSQTMSVCPWSRRAGSFSRPAEAALRIRTLW